MDLLYGLCLGILVLILIIRDKRKRNKFLSESHFCPMCGCELKKIISIEHKKKIRYNSKTYYGNFTIEHITLDCPNCDYSAEYDDN